MADGTPEKIRCDACPVMCYIAEGRTGACDRYANEGGQIIRCDPLTILDKDTSPGTDRHHPRQQGQKDEHEVSA